MTDKPIDLAPGIQLHERALADCKVAVDRADQALTAYMAPLLAEYERTRRPGQEGTYLDRDAERERLEKACREARGEVLRIGKKLEWLRGLQPSES